MRVALVTTPPSVRSGIGDYTRHLLPHLRSHCEVEVFVQKGHDEAAWGAERARLASELEPKRFDQILYQLGNEQAHAFMAHMLRALGGTVAEHDWVLFDMAMAAFPALARGGAKGHALALREGGLAQAHVYLRNWLDRRRERTIAQAPLTSAGLSGELLFGWHAPEPGGRWTTDYAGVRVPGRGVERVRFDLHMDAGRRVRVHEGGEVLLETSDGVFEVEPKRPDLPELVLETIGVKVSEAQRRHGDSRRLGLVARRIQWRDRDGEHDLDLAQVATVPVVPLTLSRDRFRLAFNRSVVRFGDAFVCHSRYVAERIRSERNAHTPLAVLHHGSESRWREGDRRAARRSLGFSEDWCNSFLVVSFGGVQAHKRIDKVLQGLAQARRLGAEVRLVLAGSMHSGEFDPVGMARHLGLTDAVRFTGYLSEVEAWDWLHAGDIAINLRGPTTGGTSGGIFQAFSMGRAVIASDAAEQKELPPDCVVRVPLGEGEVEALARVFADLPRDLEARARLEQSVRAFVASQCHWSVTARQYAEAMANFPRARASRRKLIALRVALQRSALA